MKKGDVIIVPTDTVYGLATQIFDDEGLKKIYAIKKREPQKKIPVLVANMAQAQTIALLDERAKKLIATFWPGPLTIVLSTTDTYQKKTGEKTVALRAPNHPLLLKILHQHGPLLVTSLNISGEVPLQDFEQIKVEYQHQVDHIYENKQVVNSQISSTIVDLTQKNSIEFIRIGELTKQHITDCLKDT